MVIITLLWSQHHNHGETQADHYRYIRYIMYLQYDAQHNYPPHIYISKLTDTCEIMISMYIIYYGGIVSLNYYCGKKRLLSLISNKDTGEIVPDIKNGEMIFS